MAKVPALSVIQWETQVPSLPGDIGHAGTFLKPVDMRMVARPAVGAGSTDIRPLAQAVARARGQVIATSCGVFAGLHSDLQAVARAPVVHSALCAVPHLLQTFAPSQLLIVTRDADEALLGGFAQSTADVSVAHLPAQGHIAAVLGRRSRVWDRVRAEAEVMEAIEAGRTADTRVVILECTHLVPYTTSVRARFEVPVLSQLSALEALSPGLVDPVFRGDHTLLGKAFARAMIALAQSTF